jgi:hypothetical protein
MARRSRRPADPINAAPRGPPGHRRPEYPAHQVDAQVADGEGAVRHEPLVELVGEGNQKAQADANAPVAPSAQGEGEQPAQDPVHDKVHTLPDKPAEGGVRRADLEDLGFPELPDHQEPAQHEEPGYGARQAHAFRPRRSQRRRKMFQSWGISSIAVARSSRPTWLTRGSRSVA